MANEISIIVRARDASGRVFERLNERVEGLQERLERARTKGMAPLGTAGLALGPAIIPVLAAATAGAIATGAALAGAGASLKVFSAVAKEAMTEIQDQSKEFDTLKDKVSEYGRQARMADKAGDQKGKAAALKQQAAAQADLNSKLSELDPQQRKAVQGYMGMQEAWKGFVEKNKPATFEIFGKGFALISDHVKDLQPLFDAGAQAVSRFVDSVGKWAEGGGLKGMVDYLSKQAATSLPQLGAIFANIGAGLGSLFKVADSANGGALPALERMSAAFRDWAAGDAFKTFMDYAAEQTPRVSELFKNLADAVITIAQVLTPLAPVSFAIASALAAIISAIPLEVLRAMVGAWLAYSIAMRAYGAYLLVVEVGTRAAARAMRIFNLAMAANPIGLVVVAVAALGAALYLLWTKSATARNIMAEAFSTISMAVINMAQIAIKAFQFMLNIWMNTVDGILTGALKAFSWVPEIGDKLQKAKKTFEGFKDGVNKSFDGAIKKTDEWKNAVRQMPKNVRIRGEIQDLNAKINAARAKLRTVPKSQQTKIRGDIAQLQERVRAARLALMSVKDRRIHVFVDTVMTGIVAGAAGSAAKKRKRKKATGGIIGAATGGIRGDVVEVGEEGRELVRLPTGSTVIPHGRTENVLGGGGGNGGPMVIEIKSGGSRMDDLLVEMLRRAIRARGGDAVSVLSS